MAILEVGGLAPAFTLPADDGREISLSDYAGRKVVLYFYPKDNTSGCTVEAQSFRDHLEEFKALGYEVLGVSRDSVRRHCNFRDKNALNFPLLSDEASIVCEAYDVLAQKSMYGRKYIGIERSTFLINEEGRITAIYRNVRAKTHVAELLETIRNA